MSNETANTDASKSVAQPQSLTFTETLQFTRDNFVIVSAAAVITGITFATTFLGAYLSVFDWHLVWFVQYPDIITFGVVAGAVASSSMGLLQGAVQTFLAGETIRQKINGLIVIGIFGLLFAGLAIWGSVRKGEEYTHIIAGGGAVAAAVGLIAVVMIQIQRRRLPNALQATIMLSMFVSCAIAFGRWLGETVKETSAFNQDVYLKDQTLSNVKLVIAMSRHTILLKEKVIYVLPTEDIKQFRTADKTSD